MGRDLFDQFTDQHIAFVKRRERDRRGLAAERLTRRLLRLDALGRRRGSSRAATQDDERRNGGRADEQRGKYPEARRTPRRSRRLVWSLLELIVQYVRHRSPRLSL